MTDWDSFEIIHQHLLEYWMGSTYVLSGFVVLTYMLILLSGGLPFKYSFVLTIPLVSGLALGGWLGVNIWAYHLVLLVLGVIFAVTITNIINTR